MFGVQVAAAAWLRLLACAQITALEAASAGSLWVSRGVKVPQANMVSSAQAVLGE